MRLSRIRIEQFRRFSRGVEVDGLGDGINLFVGPNEAGKSTIAQALRAAFFERHRSSSVEHLRPWGDTSAAPAVEIEFSLDGKPAVLRKRFLQRKRCELEFDGRRLEGAEAEDHLAHMLGFGFPGKGRSAAEHHGIPGLLWVEQGGAQDVEQPVAHAAEYLQRALGGVASSAGDAVLEQLEQERDELLTQAHGKPRGAYAAALASHADLGQRLTQVDAQVRAYQERVDQLADWRREQARDNADRPWLELREQEARARAGLAEVERLRRELADAQRQLGVAGQRQALHREQLAGLQAQAAQLPSRRADMQTAALAVQSARQALAACRERHAQVRALAQSARHTLDLARQEHTRRELAERVKDMRTQVERQRETLAGAVAEQQAVLGLRGEAAATELPDRELALLREQHARQRELQARQESAATRVRYRLQASRSMHIGDMPCGGDGEALIVAPTTLSLPGFGSIELVPGGDGLAEAARELGELGAAHAAVLRRLGVGSLVEAEARHQRHRECCLQLKGRETALGLLAPRGIDALRAELAALDARLRDHGHGLAQIPAPAAELPDVPRAQAADDAASQELERASRELQRCELGLAQAHAAHDTAQRELQGLETALALPDRAQRLRHAQDGLLEAGAEVAAQQRRIDALRAEIDAVQPELLEQDAQRCGASAQTLEREHAERGARIGRLETELETLGAQGLEETRDELRREHERCARRVAELERRARALDHLVRLMRDKRAELTRRLHAPLQRHLDRYVRMLLPQARLELGEDLVPRGLNRGGTDTGGFDELSFGAREQMGLLSRLAYADLLRESGRPTLIILDDALVHSDDHRLQQMKRVLFDAATRHQVLLFSCHPEKWRDLGVRPRAIGELSEPGPAR